MARAKQNKLFRTFVKGLMTEASYLTYPEDYSTDELNTVLSRRGDRTRRLGIDYENDFQLVTNVISAPDDAVSEFVWNAVNKDATLNYLVVQYGTKLHFFNLKATPVSDSHVAQTIDLLVYKADQATVDDVRITPSEMASGKGYLFVVNPFVEPLIIDLNPDTQQFEAVPVAIQMRDFDGINDSLANDEEPTSLSIEHWYNLMNQGWVTPNPITTPGGLTPPNEPTYVNPYTGGSGSYNRYNNSNVNIP